MALLLKSMWLNMVRSSPLSRSSFRSQRFSIALRESRTQSPDNVMVSLTSAPSPAEVLAAVQVHLSSMTHKHMLQALRCLFEFQKSGKTEPAMIIKNPTFNVLCQTFKKHARALEVGEAIEAAKVLSYLQVPVDSLIVQTMLQLIRHNINMINVRQIIFLDYILRGYKCNHLVDALKLALPLAFQIHLPLELDSEDMPLLCDMLSYSCSHDLPDRCVNNIITCLLLHDQELTAHDAMYIVWSLCKINCTQERFPTRAQLLLTCLDILAKRMKDLTFSEVLRTVARLKSRIVEKHPEYYHEQVMDAAADYVVDNKVDFDKALLVARALSRIAHTHLGLVFYLCDVASANPEILAEARTNVLLSFVNCLSNNNYTPDEPLWSELKKQISANQVMEGKHNSLPWIKFCLELASLNYYEDRILSKMFSREFLEDHLSREDDTLDLLQLLTINEAVQCFHDKEYSLPPDILERAKSKYPTHKTAVRLQEYFANGLGGREYVAKHVVLPSGIVADLVICLKDGHPMKLNVPEDYDRIPLERLNLPEDSNVVCVMSFHMGCYSQNSARLRGAFQLLARALRRRGYSPLLVPGSWRAVPPHERQPYFMRELARACGGHLDLTTSPHQPA
ncbi:hypothetical protein ACJJTC_012948 [Scirpophaga incertulas]